MFARVDSTLRHCRKTMEGKGERAAARVKRMSLNPRNEETRFYTSAR